MKLLKLLKVRLRPLFSGESGDKKRNSTKFIPDVSTVTETIAKSQHPRQVQNVQPVNETRYCISAGIY